jgi:uncharacterized lipoprotein YmbA
MRRLRSLALAALLRSIAGCLSHGAYRRIYSLDSASDAPLQAQTVSQRPVVKLERVLVPDYLDTTGILLRVGAHELHESTTGRTLFASV